MIETFKLAWKELASNKSRSILTALGIVIGVFAVTLIIASGEIASQYITDFLLSSVGDTKLVRVDANTNFGLNDTIITEDDLEFVILQEEILPYSSVAAEYVVSGTIESFDGEEVNQQVTGTTSNYAEVFFNQYQNLEGRFFNDIERNSASRVAVVSEAFSQNILGTSSGIGETFEILDAEFTIIGEYETQADLFSTEEQVNIPLETLWELDNSQFNELIGINVIVNTDSQIPFVSEALGDSLNAYREAQFTGSRAGEVGIRVAQSALDTVNTILISLQVFLALIAVISLVVGGIGITNVMLMTVTQRIREIGIRKALGATTRDILSIFLSESILLTVLSGIVGAGLAQYFVLVALDVLNRFVDGFNIVFVYSWESMYLATVVSIFVGLAFGIYPAIQASRFTIVDALRYD